MTGMPTIAIVFAQFAAYHVDRIEAAGQRLAGQARVVGVEVAARSRTYEWERSSGLAHAEKRTLFADADYEAVSWPRRFAELRRACADADLVFVGLPYSDPAALALMWWAKARGKRVFVMTESKADDFARNRYRESAKRWLLRCADGALVGGPRQIAYLRSLGFHDRPVLPGYDSVGTARIREQAGGVAAAWANRPFAYVGRFVPKKNLDTLLRAYAAYRSGAGNAARSLVMVGDGPLRSDLEALAVTLDIADMIDWPGFLNAEQVSERLSHALALCLVSTVEQWGLVVNEAAALGIPVIASRAVGAVDLLVEHDASGFVVDPLDVEAIAAAMQGIAEDEGRWTRFSRRASALAPRGDAECFAAGVASLSGLGTAKDAERLRGLRPGASA